FAKGLAVAKITKIHNRGFGEFQDVESEPVVSFSRLEEVLIVPPTATGSAQKKEGPASGSGASGSTGSGATGTPASTTPGTSESRADAPSPAPSHVEASVARSSPAYLRSSARSSPTC